jgi:hypothetical protein
MSIEHRSMQKYAESNSTITNARHGGVHCPEDSIDDGFLVNFAHSWCSRMMASQFRMKRIFEFLSILPVLICSTVINIILFDVFCVFLAFYLCEVGNICIIYPCANMKVEMKVLDFYFIAMVITFILVHATNSAFR